MKNREKRDMTKKEPVAVTSAKVSVKGMVVVAIIGLLGIVATAILNPLGQKWINSPSTPTVPTPSTWLEIEQIPFKVNGYSGDNTSDGTFAWNAFSLRYDAQQRPNYTLDYYLPNNGDHFAGMSFVFDKSQDLSDYGSIELTIAFGNPIDRVDLVIADPQNNQLFPVIGNGQAEITVTVDFSNFSTVNFNVINSIGFSINTAISNGSHSFTLRNIRLQKK
jgi:hypothetical protein